ncbi:MAG: hypothetical protein Q4B67_09465, partial [Eubacteriales bacterium]|nr:hypothetical protein [Eubacteriales bacterium]
MKKFTIIKRKTAAFVSWILIMSLLFSSVAFAETDEDAERFLDIYNEYMMELGFEGEEYAFDPADEDFEYEPEYSYEYENGYEAELPSEFDTATPSSFGGRPMLFAMRRSTPAEDNPDTYIFGNFPESYRTLLIELHNFYPEWKFYADPTGLDWNTAVETEAVADRSLVPNTESDTWKSQKEEDFDFKNNKWKVYDGTYWVAASKEIVAYYMDPRNWIKTDYSSSTGVRIENKSIFQFLGYKYVYPVDETELEAELATLEAALTTMVSSTYLNEHIDILMEAAKQYNMNPLTFAAALIQEQGTEGGKPLITGDYPGYEGLYNFLNVGAYNTSTMTNVERGLWWAGGEGVGKTSYGRPWNTKEKAIKGGMQYLAENYSYRYQDTIYYKRFNVHPQATDKYNHQYMTNVGGAWGEGWKFGKALEDSSMLHEYYQFHIPVYENMPETAAPKPASGKKLNPNYKLGEISIDGVTLSPAFNMNTYSYKATTGKASVYVEAEAIAGTTTVKGIGKYTLKKGINTITLTTKAQNGKTNDYVINLTYSGSSSGGGG